MTRFRASLICSSFSLLLLTGCGGSEYETGRTYYETGRTYHVTVRHGDTEAIYLVEGENITRNANTCPYSSMRSSAISKNVPWRAECPTSSRSLCLPPARKQA